MQDILERAQARLDRLAPAEALRRLDQGALLVDIRPEAQRRAEGGIPGALPIERTVLEWRLDPASAWRIPEVRDHSQGVIVICAEGCSSGLAAASLQDLGMTRATDVIGGFRAWAAAGLPVARP